MSTPEQSSLNERLSKIEEDLASIKRQIRSLFVFSVLILCVIVSPALIIPAIIAYIVWQFIDVLHRRSQRKRREQLEFLRLSGRAPFQHQNAEQSTEGNSAALRASP
jgi:hypothetical protein